MTTVEFITALFCQVDDQLPAIPKLPEARLWPSEVVTLGLLHAFKGVGNRAFYRWLMRDYRALFPRVPERTRLVRLFRTPQDWTPPAGRSMLGQRDENPHAVSRRVTSCNLRMSSALHWRGMCGTQDKYHTR